MPWPTLCSDQISFCQKRMTRSRVAAPSLQVLIWHGNLTVTPLSSPIIHQPRGDLPCCCRCRIPAATIPTGWSTMAVGGQPSLAALEDPLVDRLVWRALQRGCGAVIARTPRAAVDCNRGRGRGRPVGDRRRAPRPGHRAGARRARHRARADPAARLSCGGARSPRRSSTSGSTRRTGPITQAIEEQLGLLLDRFGCALAARLPFDAAAAATASPPIVFGDCRGRTADAWVSSEALRIARRCGFEAGLNDPFAGGHVIDRHARPARGVHALQIEIDRRCYLDPALASRAPASTASRA